MRKVIVFSKHNSVLLLLLLILCSCVVSFGMEQQQIEMDEKENEKKQDENKAQKSILHAQFIATIQTISKQNEGNDSKQVNNTFDQGATHGIETIDPIESIHITHLIRFLICMDLIDRDRFIHDYYIKLSGHYYPWYLKHHIFTQPFYRGL